jgi:thiol-disulfide isomerase/thioredoxin
MSDIPDEENRVLYEYKQLTDTLLYYSLFSGSNPATYKEFFPFYESFIPKMKAFHKKVNTSNARFNELMHAYIDMDIIYQAEYFLYTPRPEHPTPEQIDDLAPFYKDFVSSNVFSTTIILDLPKGISALRTNDLFYVSNVLKVRMADGPKAPVTAEEFEADTEEAKKERALRRADFLKRLRKVQGSSVTNDTLRGFYVLEELPRFKAYNEEYIDFMKPYRPYIELSAYVKTKVEDFETKIRPTGAGAPGFNFTFRDINDKDVSFTDFRGKIVYIDVWATWCAPCKQEMPFLKELEEEFKGEDIEFVSISLDKPKAHKKWKKFVKDHELSGVQLFAEKAFESTIAKDYKINSIPRFLLFDKEGTIINTDAKRPSDPDLKKILKKLL